jgi:hypothetical protein
MAAGGESIWWGEATDEPPLQSFGVPCAAREDARPTEN